MTGGAWPTAVQTLLLRAALLDEAPARDALDAWRARVDLGGPGRPDRLDRGSRRLLALLSERAAGSPIEARCREEYARAAAENAALMASAAGAIRRLADAGIETMLLKGLALVAAGIVSSGARPMADCDLLVRESDALAARDVLAAAGWRLEGRLDAAILNVRHGVTFRNAAGQQIDLHWHVLAECCEPGSDRAFWDASVPAAMGDVATRTLSATDMVLHACVHGVRWSIVPPVRWAADALSVMRAAGDRLDWTRLAAEGERRLVVPALVATLGYLRTSLDAPVPPAILARLEGAPVPAWVQAEYRLKLRPRSRARQAKYHWYLHRRLSAAPTVAGAAWRFPAYLWRRF
jgi:hypothetical protein